MAIDPFIKKQPVDEKGLTVLNILGLAPTKGDIGLEVEVEGNHFRKENIPPPWKYVKDGSLRGEDNAEYVLKRPITFDRVGEALSTLWAMFENDGSVLDVSNRTSIHVHLNVQNFHLNRLASFIGLYFSVEELLAAWCGDHRVGNLFCLRGKDATAIVSELKKFVKRDGCHELRDGFHYAGLNANAIQKYGSLEVRLLRGVNDPAIILEWVQMLQRLYDLSAEFNDPREIPGLLSGQGYQGYLTRLLGDHVTPLLQEIEYSPDRVRDALYTGIRLAQDICYCRDWSKYRPIDIDIDPFGRKAFGNVMPNEPGTISTGTTTAAYLNQSQWTVPLSTTTFGQVSVDEYPETPEPEYDPDEYFEEDDD